MKMDSIIRLFKAVPVTSKLVKTPPYSDVLLKKTVEKGFVFAPEVILNYSESELVELIKKIEEEVGLSGKQMNITFHKSWSKVKDSSMFQLVIEQVVHYITTYGFESLGTYSEESVYIPNEKLEVPELEEGVTLTVIKGYTKEELKQKLLELLNTGIALAEDTVADVVDVALFVDLNEQEIERIRNKETRVMLYDYLGKIPEDPVEFLRFLIYKATGKTLLIKSREVIEEIRSKRNLTALRLLRQYQTKYGLERLAQIFFRFKPLFLAFKTNSGLKPIINKIRKLADAHHKPMPRDYLNNVTVALSRGELQLEELEEELSKVNTFRKVRLAYALNFRTRDVDSILYKIRNGKGYSKEFYFDNKGGAQLVLQVVLKSIVEDIRKNVEGKRIYIPENIVYALPATEKQFTGDFPSGSYVVAPKDMVVGVHWNNVGRTRIDLDLSLLNAKVGKIGWDSRYRTEDSNVMFSGDLTNAGGKHGASELFYVAKQSDSAFIMMLNYYNFAKTVDVPFKMLVATKDSRTFGKGYMVNPNNVLCVAKSKISSQQKILGLLVVSFEDCRFFFSETSIGKSITSTNEHTRQSRKYLYDFYTNAISLNQVLVSAGAELVTEKSDADIDLSPETLEKDKIIALFK
jgi:hypothetical protein